MNQETKDVGRLMRKPEVCVVTGLTERGIENRVRAGTFPQPVLLDARQVGFIDTEVRAWVAARVADRDANVRPPHRDAVEDARARGGAKRGAALRTKPTSTTE